MDSVPTIMKKMPILQDYPNLSWDEDNMYGENVRSTYSRIQYYRFGK